MKNLEKKNKIKVCSASFGPAPEAGTRCNIACSFNGNNDTSHLL